MQARPPDKSHELGVPEREPVTLDRSKIPVGALSEQQFSNAERMAGIVYPLLMSSRTRLSRVVRPDRGPPARQLARCGLIRGLKLNERDSASQHLEPLCKRDSTRQHPAPASCGPGGRGFESRRSP